jgi:hypothetical protein
MLLIPPLRREAEAEAARIAGIHAARTRACVAVSPGDIPVTTLRRSAAHGLESPGVVFFVRARISDAAGRLLEQIVVAVKLPLIEPLHGRRRRDVRAQAQDVYDRHAAAAIAGALDQAVRRADAIALDYGQRLERAREREGRIAELVAAGTHSLVQAALFDRRALKHRDHIQRKQSIASADSQSRMESLRSGPHAVSVQSAEVALLLVVSRHG